MNKLIGMAMLLIFCGMTGYKLYAGNADFGSKYNVQMLISGLGGSYLIISEFYQSIIGFFRGFRKSTIVNGQVKEEPMETQQIDLQKLMADSDKKLCNVSDKKLCDFVALLYLKNRCIESGSKEAVDHIIAINTLLFSVETKTVDTK